MTKTARLKVYKRALRFLRGEESSGHDSFSYGTIPWQKEESGLCELLSYAKADDYNENINELVEFFMFKPQVGDKKDAGAFWWEKEDRLARELCLLLCIQMTKDDTMLLTDETGSM